MYKLKERTNQDITYRELLKIARDTTQFISQVPSTATASPDQDNFSPDSSSDNIEQLVILTTSMNEEILQDLIITFDQNPILIWEISLRQQQDKIFQVDEDTILYNINILKEYQLAKMSLIKILHMRRHKILLIMTDSNLNVSRSQLEDEPHLSETGFDIVYKVMRNFF